MRKINILIISLIAFISCQESIEYKYQDREQLVDCPGLDSKLAHEAYYSFRDDLAEYTMKNIPDIDYHNYSYSLALYIFKGAEGTADYKNIVSQHTLNILKELKKKSQIWDLQSDKSNLNYNSEFINCLIQGIQNEDVKQAIISFRKVHYQNPKSLAEFYRTSIVNAENDKYYAMFLAFETYYQYLYDLEI